MALRPLDDRCAVLTPYNIGKGGGSCDQPPAVRAVWRFDTPGPLPILLCDQHAAELAGDDRLSVAGGR